MFKCVISYSFTRNLSIYHFLLLFYSIHLHYLYNSSFFNFFLLKLYPSHHSHYFSFHNFCKNLHLFVRINYYSYLEVTCFHYDNAFVKHCRLKWFELAFHLTKSSSFFTVLTLLEIFEVAFATYSTFLQLKTMLNLIDHFLSYTMPTFQHRSYLENVTLSLFTI
jgi:hypothetical protein